MRALISIMGCIAFGLLPTVGAMLVIDSYRFGGGGGGGVTYLINEGFEGTGAPSGWTGNPDWDYTTSPIAGSQSMQVSNAEFADHTLPSTYPELWGKFRYRADTMGVLSNLFILLNASVVQIATIKFWISGYMRAESGAVGANTGDAISTGVNYYVWFHFVASTGSNGTMEVWFNTTDSKPADGGSKHAIVTTGATTGNAAYFTFAQENSTDGVYDSIQISEEEFE